MARWRAMRLKLAGLAMACVAVLMASAAVGQDFSGVVEQAVQTVPTVPEEVSVSQARDKREQRAFILDVRQPEEWNQAHIPGATLIPLGQLEKRMDELPKDKEIVIICRSGGRSAMARDILIDRGFKRVTSVEGGMNAWQDAGYPTVSGP